MCYWILLILLILLMFPWCFFASVHEALLVCGILVWLWHEGHAGLMKCIWYYSLLFKPARIWEGLALIFLWFLQRIYFYSHLFHGFSLLECLWLFILSDYSSVYIFQNQVLIVCMLLEVYPICWSILSIYLFSISWNISSSIYDLNDYNCNKDFKFLFIF